MILQTNPWNSEMGEKLKVNWAGRDSSKCPYVTESKLTLPTTQQANKLGDEVSRQGIATLFGKLGI